MATRKLSEIGREMWTTMFQSSLKDGPDEIQCSFYRSQDKYTEPLIILTPEERRELIFEVIAAERRDEIGDIEAFLDKGGL